MWKYFLVWLLQEQSKLSQLEKQTNEDAYANNVNNLQTSHDTKITETIADALEMKNGSVIKSTAVVKKKNLRNQLFITLTKSLRMH